MPIYIGQSTKNQQDISHGGQLMQKVYVGDKLVWPLQFTPVNYGLLYNFDAATNPKNIASPGWRLSSHQDWRDLAYNLTGYTIGQNVPNLGGKLKETGTTHWDSPNADATNEVGFNCRGGGRRIENGTFGEINQTSNFHTGAIYETYGPIIWTASYSTGNMVWNFGSTLYKFGACIRVVKETTTLTNGQTGTYIDPSGFIYPTICIGNREWVACSVRTIHFQDGTPIPYLESNSDWANATGAGFCYANGNPANM